MEYQWEIAGLDYQVSLNGLSNVVTVAHWRASREDENGNKGSVYGTQLLPEPNPDNFIAWDALDKTAVLSWVTDEMNRAPEPIAIDNTLEADGDAPPPVDKVTTADIEASIDAQIAEKANPTRGSGVPWGEN